ncbi:hypothetical protein CLI75_12375, partial [Porphyromonas gingivalis]
MFRVVPLAPMDWILIILATSLILWLRELEENEYGEECTQLKVGKGILYRPEVEEGSSPCTEVEVHHAV